MDIPVQLTRLTSERELASIYQTIMTKEFREQIKTTCPNYSEEELATYDVRMVSMTSPLEFSGTPCHNSKPMVCNVDDKRVQTIRTITAN